VRGWLWLIRGAGDPIPGLSLLTILLSVSFVLSLFRRSETLAPRIALPILLVQLVQTFPLTHNHFVLELLAVAILSTIGSDKQRDEALALQALQWLFAIVLFHSGIQKALYGLYFHGDFLAFMVGQTERFALPFSLLLDSAEIDRLRSYDVWATGAGPFRVKSVPFLFVSNLVYLAEIGLAALLLIRRTRSVAATAAIALVLAIQVGARELGFAFLFVSGLLLFLENNWNGRLLPAFVLGGAVALGAAAGWLPGAAFMETINP
jgi:hypothetical protein